MYVTSRGLANAGWWLTSQCFHHDTVLTFDHSLPSFSLEYLIKDPSIPLRHKASFLWWWRVQTTWTSTFLEIAWVLNWKARLAGLAENSSSTTFYHGRPSPSACTTWMNHKHSTSSPLALRATVSSIPPIELHQNSETLRPSMPYVPFPLVNDRLSYRPFGMGIVLWEFWKQSDKPIKHHLTW